MVVGHAGVTGREAAAGAGSTPDHFCCIERYRLLMLTTGFAAVAKRIFEIFKSSAAVGGKAP
jgi:hypothetical protein